VIVGPNCVIGPEVEIGKGTRLSSHVCLLGATRLGEFNTIGSFVTIGSEPQDVTYWGAPTRVEIGDHNTIDARVTIHRASQKEDGVTGIGNGNHFHSGAHIAHDCKLADRIVLGIGTLLGGHVHVDSDAAVSEKVAVHQFVTIGGESYIGGHSKITQDVPPYMRVDGNPSIVRGINGRKLKRKGMNSEALAALREAHRLIYVVKMAIEQAATLLEDQDRLTPEVRLLVKFVASQREGRLGRARERRRST
jgi:UDP-N-acetylglucosamine acyltransferase